MSPTTAARLRGLLPAARSGTTNPDERLRRAYRKHANGLYRYAMSIVRDPADAEDVLQTTMERAAAQLGAAKPPEQLRPWLYRVAHNEAISTLRRRRPEGELAPAGEGEPAALPHLQPDVSLERRERLRNLVDDLGELAELPRSALLMRELSGLGYAEIAVALETSEGGARQAVYEARTALADMAEGREMECEIVRRTISEGDARRLRGKKIRAHLRTCDGCRAFRDSIEQRREDFGLLFPPLPLAGLAAILGGLGGGSVGSGAAGTAGVAGGTAAGAASLGAGAAATGAGSKGLAVAVAALVGVGGASAGGIIDPPGPLGGGAAEELVERVESSAPGPGGGSTEGDEAEAQLPAADGADRPPPAARGKSARGERGGRGSKPRGRQKAENRKGRGDKPAKPGRGSDASEGAAAGAGGGRATAPPGTGAGNPGPPSAPPGQQPGGPGSASGNPNAGRPDAPGRSGSAPGRATPPPTAGGRNQAPPAPGPPPKSQGQGGGPPEAPPGGGGSSSPGKKPK